jgi:hypothetical protein
LWKPKLSSSSLHNFIHTPISQILTSQYFVLQPSSIYYEFPEPLKHTRVYIQALQTKIWLQYHWILKYQTANTKFWHWCWSRILFRPVLRLKVLRLRPYVLITAVLGWRVWRICGMILTGNNQRTRTKLVPTPLCPPSTSHRQSRDRIRDCTTKSQRQTTSKTNFHVNST